MNAIGPARFGGMWDPNGSPIILKVEKKPLVKAEVGEQQRPINKQPTDHTLFIKLPLNRLGSKEQVGVTHLDQFSRSQDVS